LQNTAYHLTTDQECGGDSHTAVPNNTFGYGIVDASAAIAYWGLGLSKTVSRQPAQPPNTVTYVLSVTNVISSPIAGVVVTDHVPLGTTYVPGSIGGPGANGSQAPELQWNVGVVPSLTVTSTMTLSFTVSIDIGPVRAITNTANIFSTDAATKSSNDVSSFTPYWSLLPLILQ
jgi:uncharacterized repeat protein (TIGR01451 family)